MLSPEQVVTEFNRRLYSHLLDRDRQGLLVELAFLAANYDQDGMAYISRMVQEAKEHTVTPEEILRLAAVIREEHALRHLNDPAAVTDQDIQSMLDALRARKQDK